MHFVFNYLDVHLFRWHTFTQLGPFQKLGNINACALHDCYCWCSAIWPILLLVVGTTTYFVYSKSVIGIVLAC